MVIGFVDTIFVIKDASTTEHAQCYCGGALAAPLIIQDKTKPITLRQIMDVYKTDPQDNISEMPHRQIRKIQPVTY